jgi:hypothetical protein
MSSTANLWRLAQITTLGFSLACGLALGGPTVPTHGASQSCLPQVAVKPDPWLRPSSS